MASATQSKSATPLLRLHSSTHQYGSAHGANQRPASGQLSTLSTPITSERLGIPTGAAAPDMSAQSSQPGKAVSFGRSPALPEAGVNEHGNGTGGASGGGNPDEDRARGGELMRRSAPVAVAQSMPIERFGLLLSCLWTDCRLGLFWRTFALGIRANCSIDIQKESTHTHEYMDTTLLAYVNF